MKRRYVQFLKNSWFTAQKMNFQQHQRVFFAIATVAQESTLSKKGFPPNNEVAIEPLTE